MEPIKGYCILDPTLCGPSLWTALCGPSLWTVEEEDEEVMPEIFDTVHEARRAIVEDFCDKLQEFLMCKEDDGMLELAWDTLDKEIQQYPAHIEIENENILVWEDRTCGGSEIINMSLKDWRENL